MAIELSTDIKSARQTKQTRARSSAKGRVKAPKARAPKVVITNSALTGGPFDSDKRHALIAEAAYRLAEQRSFSPGSELDDWLAAEAEVDARLYGETHPF